MGLPNGGINKIFSEFGGAFSNNGKGVKSLEKYEGRIKNYLTNLIFNKSEYTVLFGSKK